MQDHIVIAKNKVTNLFHALLYQNRPTPSGCDRSILQLSTPTGRASGKQALRDMTSALKPEYLLRVALPKLEEV